MAQRKSAPSRKTAGRSTTGRSTTPRTARPAAGAGTSAADATDEAASTKPAAKPATKPASGATGAKPAAGATGAKPASGTTAAGAARPASSKPTTPRTAAAKKSAARKTSGSKGPQGRKKPKSIVNQKQTPWGLIITTALVVVFAAVVVIAVVATHKSSSDATATKGGQAVSKSDPYRQPEAAAAAAIPGVTYTVEGEHTHIDGHIKYDTTPPVGGDHSQYWADCTGTVYPKAIASENAVHMLEHGAVWITYNANQIKGAQLAKLKTYVSGIDRMAMSPYPNLSAPISLQSWGYQLKVSNASDPRIAKFIAALKYNQKTTPEYGATCSQPTFIQHPSTFGNPLWVPASGASGNTGGK